MGCRGNKRIESVGSDIDYGVRPPSPFLRDMSGDTISL